MFIKKILCPIDRSSDAKIIMSYTISLAQEHKAELIFFHVTHFPSMDHVYPCDPNPYFVANLAQRFTIEELVKRARFALSQFVRANFGSDVRGLSWKIGIGIGKIPREIVAAAVDEEADLIVMTKREQNFFFRLFTRSISNAVSEQAPCPVLSLCPPRVI